MRHISECDPDEYRKWGFVDIASELVVEMLVAGLEEVDRDRAFHVQSDGIPPESVVQAYDYSPDRGEMRIWFSGAEPRRYKPVLGIRYFDVESQQSLTGE